ncbi:MAG: hypothetical protein ETSY1_09180 [Candidatus Entotheonella factor]|uniref:CN hydrolase domain-containing protein n=1 Tax=Entotheonella factor TaxID=1429438 RepID=W4LUA8_ENTF1|nr:MAG: hypothetical protein ETSY1_09180 [Candidatus Entotheonella factor]
MTGRVFILPLLALVIGIVAWPGEWGRVTLMPLSLLVPVFWAWSPRAWQAVLVGLAYHLAASRGLPEGAATYFGEGLPVGIGLWLGAGALLALTYGVIWHRRFANRLWRLPLLLLLLAVPPVGIVGWAHPLTATGFLFPAQGWWGFMAGVVLIMVLADLPKPQVRLGMLGAVMGLLMLLLGARSSGKPVVAVQGTDTYLAYDTNRLESQQSYLHQYELIDLVLANRAPTVVLPESAAGHWDAGKRSLWREAGPALEGRRVFMGGAHRAGDGRLENVLIQVSGASKRIVYRQRMPVPVAMWRPWSPESFNAAWWTNPTFDLGGVRAAALICYEHYLVWPVLQSMRFEPDLLIGIGNVWWAKEKVGLTPDATSLPAIQQAALRAWAKLFDVQLVTAFNFGEKDGGAQPLGVARP